MKAAILINYSANNGTAEKKWLKIKDRVLELFPSKPLLIPYQGDFNMHACLEGLIRNEGVNFFISAGGDGSINNLLNQLIVLCGYHLNAFCLGGIGLGSSNDFLKPASNYIDEIAVKINLSESVLSDIGVVQYYDRFGTFKTKAFIVNASLGVVAEANSFFNEGNFYFRFLKKKFVGVAIVYAAIHTIFHFENKIVQIITDNSRSSRQVVANISIVKNPNISGNFRYDHQTAINSGLFGLHIIGDVSHFELLKILRGLSKGRFPIEWKCSTSFESHIEIEADQQLLFETDGEVCESNHLKFYVEPAAIRLAG